MEVDGPRAEGENRFIEQGILGFLGPLADQKRRNRDALQALPSRLCHTWGCLCHRFRDPKPFGSGIACQGCAIFSGEKRLKENKTGLPGSEGVRTGVVTPQVLA